MTPVPPALLSRVPGCRAGETALSINALAGGRGVNRVWHVRTHAGDFVLRLRHPPIDRPGSFSGFELASHRLAAAAGLAPRVVAAAHDGHWLVMEYVNGPVWTDSQLLSDAGVEAVGELLRRLHGLACPELPRMNVAAIAHAYMASITTRTPKHASKAAAELEMLEQASGELARLTDRAVLNHGDLMAANFIGHGAGTQPLLVDWEYAQRADPTWDVACMLAYYPGIEPRLESLLAALGLDSARDRQILSLQRRLFEGLNRLWQRAHSGNWIS
jgi:aminoglycoside phosphotransferase (APT) family kinase protein